MRITCLTTFLDGQRRFEKGDVVTVPDADAAKFQAHGWASADGVAAEPPAVPEVALAIQNVTVGHKTVTEG